MLPQLLRMTEEPFSLEVIKLRRHYFTWTRPKGSKKSKRYISVPRRNS